MQPESSSYNEDYKKICRLEADVEVLEKKVTDYTRIEQGVQAEFDNMVRKMAGLEMEVNELDNFSWKKLKYKVTRKYDEVYSKNITDREAAQREMDSIKFRLQDVRGKLKDTKARLEAAKKQYNAQRTYMREKYTQYNEYEEQIKNENTRLRSVIKEIDEALAAVNEVMEVAKLARDKFKSARNWGVADIIIDDGLFADIVKYNSVNSAQSMVYALNSCIERLNKELRDVNNIYAVYCQEFDSGLKFADMIFDNMFVDWMALERIEQNIGRIDSLIIKLEETKKNLEGNRRQATKQLKE